MKDEIFNPESHVSPQNAARLKLGSHPFEVDGFGPVEFFFPVIEEMYSPGAVALHITQVIDHDQYKIKHNLKPGDVVIDVGGSIGTFVWLACQLGARCYTFEPSRKEFPVLSAFINHHGLLAEAIPMAVSSHSGTLQFHCGWLSTLGDGQVVDDGPLMHVEGDLSEEFFEVPAVSLDDFVAGRGIDRVNVIKVDTEGHERDVLLGAMQTIDRDRPRLLLSAYHRPGDVESLVDFVLEYFPQYIPSYSLGGGSQDEMIVIMTHPPR